MKPQQLIAHTGLILIMVGMSLPVKVVETVLDSVIQNPISTPLSISGIDLDFPFLILYPFVAVGVYLLINFGRGVKCRIFGVISAIILGAYAILTLIVIQFDLFAVTRPGIGYYLLASGALTLFVLSVLKLVSSYRFKRKPNRLLLDESFRE